MPTTSKPVYKNMPSSSRRWGAESKNPISSQRTENDDHDDRENADGSVPVAELLLESTNGPGFTVE
ncbi:hypothetical protein [Natrinema sp. CBA1119]|uniref:hypothetical protein n=1 Tax=Natrinema sp. CBA1119 TaxID=1608465 RepID=UPI0011457E99|nr:hypothetical protein [Natrinema sp. CBA1119]